MSGTIGYEYADPVPSFVLEHRVCQGYGCRETATWNRWRGFYCTDHAIRAGWIPGPVRRPGEQLRLSA